MFFFVPSTQFESSYSGYGYKVRFVEDFEDIDNDMAASLQWALSEIRAIQKAARSGKPIIKPRWPLLVLRTPKVFSILNSKPPDIDLTRRDFLDLKRHISIISKDHTYLMGFRFQTSWKTKKNSTFLPIGLRAINLTSYSIQKDIRLK